MTSFKDYPYTAPNTLDDIKETLRQIAKIRKDDITQIKNLSSTFISGRRVGKVPSSSADVATGDKIGDFNVTDTYAYFLVESAGSGVWRRVAVGSW